MTAAGPDERDVRRGTREVAAQESEREDNAADLLRAAMEGGDPDERPRVLTNRKLIKTKRAGVGPTDPR